MSLNALLGLPEDSSDDDMKDVKPVCKRSRLEEPRKLVDISPQKAIEEEIIYQKVQANYVTQTDLQENRSLLLKFLEGSEVFLKKLGTDCIGAAGEFIFHKVKQCFAPDAGYFSPQEQEWLEENADCVVRILERIQCRQYVLDKKLAVPKITVDGYFVRARAKMNEAVRKEIERKADLMQAKRVRNDLRARFELSSRRVAEATKTMIGTNEDANAAVSDPVMNMLINAMKKLSTSQHNEFSRNPAYEDICAEVVGKLFALQVAESRIKSEPEFAVLSSPPRASKNSAEGSRSPSPEQSARSGQAYAFTNNKSAGADNAMVEESRIKTEPLPSSPPRDQQMSQKRHCSRMRTTRFGQAYVVDEDISSNRPMQISLSADDEVNNENVTNSHIEAEADSELPSNPTSAPQRSRERIRPEMRTARVGQASAADDNISSNQPMQISSSADVDDENVTDSHIKAEADFELPSNPTSAPQRSRERIRPQMRTARVGQAYAVDEDISSTHPMQVSSSADANVDNENVTDSHIRAEADFLISSIPTSAPKRSSKRIRRQMRTARVEQAFAVDDNISSNQPMQISSSADVDNDNVTDSPIRAEADFVIPSIPTSAPKRSGKTSSDLKRYMDPTDADTPGTSAMQVPDDSAVPDSTTLPFDDVMEVEYQNDQDQRRSCLRSSSHFAPAKHVRFRDVYPRTIQIYERASENDREKDFLWKENLCRKPMWYDNGTTLWYRPLSYKEGSRFLIEKLTVKFLLPHKYPWAMVGGVVADQQLPTFPGIQPKIRYILPKNKETLKEYFASVFKRLCNFQSRGFGTKNICEYTERFGGTGGMQMMYKYMKPEYNKLLLTDSFLGMCNPDVLLNTCLLSCHPRINLAFFIKQMFEFIRDLVTRDLSIVREKELAREQEELKANGQEGWLPSIYFEQDLYEKYPDFDVSGGVFLSFGHDMLFNFDDMRPDLADPRRRSRRDPCYAAIAQCIALTIKVIYELQKLWTLKNWWDTRKFPDIWLLTIPEGIHHDYVSLYNDLLRKAVASTDVFPVAVKLMDWDALLRIREQGGRHNGLSNLPIDVEESQFYEYSDTVVIVSEVGFAHLFCLMKHKADLRYRRSEEERKYDIRRANPPGENDNSYMFQNL